MAKQKIPHFYKVVQGCEGMEVGKVLVFKKSCGPTMYEMVIDSKTNNVTVVKAEKIPNEDMPAEAIDNAIVALWGLKAL